MINKLIFAKLDYFLLYVLGVILWFLFFYYKNPSLNYEDWLYYFQYYDVIKESLRNLKIPFHVSLFTESMNLDIGEKQPYGTKRFLSNEWTIFPIQSIILVFVNTKTYIFLNYILIYSLSFFYLLKWSKKLNLSKTSFFYLVLIFLFNGKFISLTAFGGPQMTFGYMLIPMSFWYMFNFLHGNQNKLNSLKMSLFLIFLLSQTDAHILYQNLLIFSFATLFYPKKYTYFITILIFFIIGSLWFILPVALFSGLSVFSDNILSLPPDHWRNYGLCGYGIQNGFVGYKLFQYNDNIFQNFFFHGVNILNHIYESLTVEYNTYFHNSHEYNLYISELGFLILLLTLIYLIYLYKNNLLQYILKYKFIFGLFIIFCLSVSCTNRSIIILLNNLVSFHPIDAVPSRLMIYIFTFVAFLSAIGFSKFKEKNTLISFLKYLIILCLSGILFYHSIDWWIYYSILNTQAETNLIPNTKFYDIDDHFYKYTVLTSYLISIIFVISLIIFYFHYKKKVN
tara:strand:+ start:3182 stop:4708 length:1527 start_codon:yes stop_codon:yes gene_type:complete